MRSSLAIPWRSDASDFENESARPRSSEPLHGDLDDDELVELARFLASPGPAETSMDLYGVDGYFAAILSGPRDFMPAEWVPRNWDSERRERAPECEDLAGAQRILGLLMRRDNPVARALMDDGEPFVPIHPDGTTDAAGSCCAGYLTGVALDPEGWEELVVAEPRAASWSSFRPASRLVPWFAKSGE